jgi:hypothetical protein
MLAMAARKKMALFLSNERRKENDKTDIASWI